MTKLFIMLVKYVHRMYVLPVSFHPTAHTKHNNLATLFGVSTSPIVGHCANGTIVCIYVFFLLCPKIHLDFCHIAECHKIINHQLWSHVPSLLINGQMAIFRFLVSDNLEKMLLANHFVARKIEIQYLGPKNIRN